MQIQKMTNAYCRLLRFHMAFVSPTNSPYAPYTNAVTGLSITTTFSVFQRDSRLLVLDLATIEA